MIYPWADVRGLYIYRTSVDSALAVQRLLTDALLAVVRALQAAPTAKVIGNIKAYVNHVELQDALAALPEHLR